METTATKNNNGLFGSLANPVIRKMEKKAECSDSRAATYGGIAGKTIFFLIVTIIAALGYIAVHNIIIASATDVIHIVPEEGEAIYDLTIAAPEIIVILAAALISIIVPFLAWLVRSTIPVVGTIYSVAQGVVVGFITAALRADLKWISLLAAVLTIMLVGAMMFVYTKRIIKVTARFRGIIVVLFGTIVLAGILLFILNLIPATRELMSGINQIMENPVVSIIISAIFVIIAALFMLADFDTIERCVTNKMDKKYEWMAAWGLAYTVLYIYFKILRIILTIAGNSSNNSKNSTF